jgi:hypothetical protein
MAKSWPQDITAENSPSRISQTTDILNKKTQYK